MAYLKLLLPIALDTLSFVLVVLPTLVLPFTVKPYHRGFFCDDNSISYPYREDTISGRQIVCSCILIPTCLFVVFEVIHYVVKRSRNSHIETTGRGSIPNIFVMLYTVLAIFVFGFAVSTSISNISKFVVGRLRPHFLSICKPDLTKVNCSSIEHMIYIEEDICTRPYDRKLMDSRLSFPSGHATMAAYAAVFLALYIQARMTWKSTRSLRHCLQAILAFLAVFVCLSRMSDFKHHWSDVVAGASLGAVTAVLTGLHLMHRFKAFQRKDLDHQTLPYHDLSSADVPSEKTALLK